MGMIGLAMALLIVAGMLGLRTAAQSGAAAEWRFLAALGGFGCLLMGLGGIWAVTDRRYRIKNAQAALASMPAGGREPLPTVSVASPAR
jgi:hypothetical protein